MAGPIVAGPVVGGGTTLGISAGTQSVNSATVVFSNSNGISFGMSGSSRITASYTVPTETPFGVSAGTQSVSTGTLVFSNSHNVSFGMSGSSRVTASASYAAETPFGISAGTQSVSTGTMVFSNSNGVSFGMSGSSRVTASIATSLTAINVSGGTTSNNLSAIVFSNSNGVSFGMNGSTMTASVAAGGGAGYTAGFSTMGNTFGDTGLVTGRLVLVGSNNLTLSGSTNAGSMTVTISGPTGGGMGVSTGGATLGDTGTVGAQVVLAASNGITLSQATAAGGSATITIAGPGDKVTLSNYNPYPGFWAMLGSAAVNSSLVIQPFLMPLDLTASIGNVHISGSLSTSSNSSFANAVSISMGIYTRNASTLSLATSGSKLYQYTITGSTSSGSWQGWREYSVPLSVTMTAGEYWMGILIATATSNTNWGQSLMAQVNLQAPNTQFSGAASVASNATHQPMMGFGSYSAGTAALPASIAFSQIRGAGAAIYRSIPYWNLGQEL